MDGVDELNDFLIKQKNSIADLLKTQLSDEKTWYSSVYYYLKCAGIVNTCIRTV